MGRDQYWIGVDLGETSSSICFLNADNAVSHTQTPGASTREIAAGLEKVDQKCIEAIVLESSAGHKLPRELAALGFPILTVDARLAHKFLSIRSLKTDDNDARGLAEIAKYGSHSSLRVHIKSVTCEQVRLQLALRDQLLRNKVAARNALRAHLRTLGSELTRLPSPTRLHRDLQPEIERMRREGLSEMVPEIVLMMEMVEALQACAKRLDIRIKRLAQGYPIVSKFTKIPGVGPITALSFFSAIENPHRFRRSADVGAYLGLVPGLKQSGSIKRSGRITKAGNKLARGHLYMSAGTIMTRNRQNTEMGDWANALHKRIGFSKARVALARKLAVIMLSIWKADTHFLNYPRLADVKA